MQSIMKQEKMGKTTFWKFDNIDRRLSPISYNYDLNSRHTPTYVIAAILGPGLLSGEFHYSQQPIQLHMFNLYRSLWR